MWWVFIFGVICGALPAYQIGAVVATLRARKMIRDMR